MTSFENTEWTMAKIEETFNKMHERVKIDSEFRQLCITDVNSAIKEVSGLELPEGFEVRLVEGANGEIMFAGDSQSELDESELEMVAGGTSFSAFELEKGTWINPYRKGCQVC